MLHPVVLHSEVLSGEDQLQLHRPCQTAPPLPLQVSIWWRTVIVRLITLGPTMMVAILLRCVFALRTGVLSAESSD